MIVAPFPESDSRDRCIGLMADSHGCLSAIKNGLACLKDGGADVVIHLGDIFDSLRNDALDHIYDTIRRHRVFGVKGNNDYQIETLLAAGASMGISPEKRQKILSFLQNLPLRREDDNICFAHSLPFDGIRSFYEPIDTGATQRAVQLFDQMKYKILFCGHSHTSILFRWRRGKVTREPLHPEAPFQFQPRERYILIVGAADRGEYGIFNRTDLTYRRIVFHSPG